jgi:hypothetical protein
LNRAGLFDFVEKVIFSLHLNLLKELELDSAIAFTYVAQRQTRDSRSLPLLRAFILLLLLTQFKLSCERFCKLVYYRLLLEDNFWLLTRVWGQLGRL